MAAMHAGISGSAEDACHTRTLPLDIIRRIVELLWDNPPALAACARTSKQWLPSSTHQLYSDLCLLSVKRARCLILAARLPDITSALSRSRALQVASGFKLGDDYFKGPMPSFWNTLAAFSTLCPRVETLRIGSAFMHDQTSQLQRDHLDLIRAGFVHVTRLYLNTLNTPNCICLQQLLCALPALKSVDFHDVRVLRDNIHGPSSSSHNHAPALTHLGVNGMSDLASVSHWLRHGPARQSMRSLSLMTTVKPVDHQGGGVTYFTEEERWAQQEQDEWIDVTGPQLEKLSLAILYVTDWDYVWSRLLLEKLNLSRCTAVRRLDLTCIAVQQAVLVLESLSLDCRIQTLHLQFHTHTDTAPLLVALSAPQLSQLKHLHMHTEVTSKEEASGQFPGKTVVAELAERYPCLSVRLTHSIVEPG